MEIWNNKSTKEILQSIESEVAKAQNEIKCAEGDIRKAQNRIAFTLSAIHNLKNRDLKGIRYEIKRISRKTKINRNNH